MSDKFSSAIPTGESASLFRWGILPLWLLLTTTIYFRYLVPIDETRYLSVAWEMWLRGDFWVPYLNGKPYSHKPPLLFWLFQVGWGVFGINEWWPRLVGPFCALANLLLVRQLARKLWPELGEVALLAPWILIATLLWTLFATAAMFDVLLTCLVLLAMLGLLDYWQGCTRKGLGCFSLAIGLGLLAKGPVIFLHVLPSVMLMGFCSGAAAPKHYLLKLFLTSLAGVALALCWAVPAALMGGEEFSKEIFWQQIADRTIATEIHVRPFFWYVKFLPLLLFPWVFWWHFWQKCKEAMSCTDMGMRFCLLWFCGGLLIFSILASKQIHYLIPILPAFALFVARVLVRLEISADRRYQYLLPFVFALVGFFLMMLPEAPGLSKYRWVQQIHAGWGLWVVGTALVLTVVLHYLSKFAVMAIACALVFSVWIGFICFFQYTGLAYNLRPAALQVKTFDQKGIACAFVGTYHGQFQFLGRLTKPLETLSMNQVSEWVKLHPDGYLISLEKTMPDESFYQQEQREYWLVFRRAAQYNQLEPL